MKKKKELDEKDDKLLLKDYLHAELYGQLKAKKKELELIEKQKEEEEKKRRIEEQKLREKNKTFEELLNESNLDWRNFK